MLVYVERKMPSYSSSELNLIEKNLNIDITSMDKFEFLEKVHVKIIMKNDIAFCFSNPKE